MKTFEANNDLADILIKHGFIEISDEDRKARGKRDFQKVRNSKKVIIFDHQSIRVMFDGFDVNSTRFYEDELKIIIWIYSLSNLDVKELFLKNNRSIEYVKERKESIKKELERLKEFNYQISRQNKLQRILTTFDELTL